ncbi:MAG: hypothetical protein JW395_2029 [Nitrospira sp.]|nr:hypothetical protein [Nitrospira sp.]
MPSRFATPGCLVLSAGRYVKVLPSLADQYIRMQGLMNWSGSDDLKGVTGVSGNQFTAGSAVIVVGQIIVVVMFQFQVQMPTR